MADIRGFDRYTDKLKELAERVARVKDERDEHYFTTRTINEQRDFFIACRHWNSSTPAVPRQYAQLLPYPHVSGYGFGGGYFMALNGVGIVVDPGYGFMRLLYNSYGYTICDVDVVFVTHDHPDHWADLFDILVLKHMAASPPSREPKFYLNRTVSGLEHFLFPPGHTHHAIGRGQVVPIIRPEDGRTAVTVTGVRAFHSERLYPKSNSPNAIGLHFEIAQLQKQKRGLRHIAIAGDTQFPSVLKRKDGLQEFTERDVAQFNQEYDGGQKGDVEIGQGPRGERMIDVLAMHIGSVEKKLTELPERDALQFLEQEVFYDGYHLGFAGCLRLLNTAFRGDQSGKLALLTEFGEELRGHRVDLARALEGSTSANANGQTNVNVLPADIGIALQLSWDAKSPLREPLLRCSKCLRLQDPPSEQALVRARVDLMKENLFHPLSKMQIFEDLDTGLVQYSCRW